MSINYVNSIRRIDDLGRIVIPKEYRRVLGISEGDSLNIEIQGDALLLRKHETSCVFCRKPVADGIQFLCDECQVVLREHKYNKAKAAQ